MLLRDVHQKQVVSTNSDTNHMQAYQKAKPYSDYRLPPATTNGHMFSRMCCLVVSGGWCICLAPGVRMIAAALARERRNLDPLSSEAFHIPRNVTPPFGTRSTSKQNYLHHSSVPNKAAPIVSEISDVCQVLSLLRLPLLGQCD